MRTLFQTAAVLLLLTGSTFAASLAQTTAQLSPRQWTEVRDAERGFSIQFPAPAARTTPDSGEVKWAIELDNGWTAYLVQVGQITQERLRDAGPDGVLEGAVEGGLKQFPGAAVLDRARLELGGNPGRRLVMKVEHQGTPMIITSRVFLVKTRVYIITAVARESSHDAAESERFLKSFALISQ